MKQPEQLSKPTRAIFAVTSHLTANGLLPPQVKCLTDLGWDVGVICSPGPVDESLVTQCAFVDHVAMSRSIDPMSDIKALRRLRRVLKTRTPDLVVASTPKAGLLVTIAAVTCRVPIRVLQLRGARWDGVAGAKGWILRKADWLAIKCATDVTSVSQSLSKLFVDSRVSTVLPVVLGPGGSKGVDLEVFHPATDYEFDSDQPRLGFAGRLSVDKGIRTVLATFQSVKAVLPNVTLEIFGDQDASDPIPTDLVNALGTEPGLTLRSSSPREELAQAMRHWDLLLFPSAREGLPNVVIEAAGCGVPTIGWNVTGVKDAVREGSSGYLLALGDEEEFFRSTLLSLSSAKHKFLRVGAISIAGEFSALQVQALFANYLEKLVASYKTV